MRNFIKLNIIFLGFLIFFTSKSIGADEERMRNYFQNEVMNTLDEDSKQGLLRFLIEVCELNEGPKWVDMSQE